MGIRQLDFSDGFSSATTVSGGFVTVATSSESISDASEITLLSSGVQLIKVNGNAAPATASITPFGSTSPGTGTIIYLMGTDSTNTVEIINNDAATGAILNGNATLGNYSMLILIYDGTLDRYIEIGRNF